MTKNFERWHLLKQRLDAKADREVPLFKERQIWWCSVGVNVGYEILGKNDNFVRPVLIIRRYSPLTFFGLPMTSRRKNIPAHYHFRFSGVDGSILLDQGKVFDSRRLVRQMGRISTKKVVEVKKAFISYL